MADFDFQPTPSIDFQPLEPSPPKGDFTSRMKEFLVGSEPQPGEAQPWYKTRTAFGTPDVLAPVRHGLQAVGNFILPETNIGAAGELGTIALGVPATKMAIKGLSAIGTAIGTKLGTRITQAGRVADVAKVLDRPAKIADRIIEGTKPLNDAYAKARAVNATVPTDTINTAIEKALMEGPIDEGASKLLGFLKDSDLVGNTANAKYIDLVHAQKGLAETLGSFNNISNQKIRSVKDAITAATETIDPALANADRMYGHYKGSEEILRLINRSSASGAKTAVENLLTKKPWLAEQLGLDNPSKLEVLSAALDAALEVAPRDVQGPG